MEDMGDVVGGTGVHIVIACKALFDLERGVYEGDGVETRATSSQQLAQLAQKDEQALGIIITSLDDNFIHYIDDCTTAVEAWQTLEKKFGLKVRNLGYP